MIKPSKYASVVQLVECRSPKPMVSGSSPDGRAKRGSEAVFSGGAKRTKKG